MDFKTAIEHEDNNKPIMYQGHQYYVEVEDDDE